MTLALYGKSRRRQTLLGGLAIAALAFAVALALNAAERSDAASPPQPTYGSATVDGNTGEWDLNNDFFANMYRAADDTKEIESKLYLRYECSTTTLFILVLGEPGVPVLVQPDNSFVKLGNSTTLVDGHDNNDGTPPDFAWVNQSNGNADGFEASATLAEASYSNLNVHVNVFDDGEEQTSAVVDRAIDLVLACPTQHDIFIKKVTVNDPDPTPGSPRFIADVTNGGTVADDEPFDTNSTATVSVDEGGSYTVTEGSLPTTPTDDWTVTGKAIVDGADASCDGVTWDTSSPATASGGPLSNLDGDVTVCFRNEYTPPPPQIHIRKVIQNDPGTPADRFSANLLKSDNTGVAIGLTFDVNDPASHTLSEAGGDFKVAENVPGGGKWTQAGWAILDGEATQEACEAVTTWHTSPIASTAEGEDATNGGSLNGVDSDQTVCFLNEPVRTVRILKVATGDTGTFTGTITAHTPSAWSVEGTATGDDPTDIFDVSTAAHTVTETGDPGGDGTWTLVGYDVREGLFDDCSAAGSYSTASGANDIPADHNHYTVCISNTFTPTQVGERIIRVCKVVEDNGDLFVDGGEFDFSVDSETTQDNFGTPAITAEENGGAVCQNVSVPEDADVVVSETGAPQGWSQVSGFPTWAIQGGASGSGSTASTIPAGTATVTVTFTNKTVPMREIEVCKIVEDNQDSLPGQGGDWDFEIVGIDLGTVGSVTDLTATEGGGEACETVTVTATVDLQVSEIGTPIGWTDESGYPQWEIVDDSSGSGHTSGVIAAGVEPAKVVFTNKTPEVPTRTIKIIKLASGFIPDGALPETFTGSIEEQVQLIDVELILDPNVVLAAQSASIPWQITIGVDEGMDMTDPIEVSETAQFVYEDDFGPNWSTGYLLLNVGQTECPTDPIAYFNDTTPGVDVPAGSDDRVVCVMNVYHPAFVFVHKVVIGDPNDETVFEASIDGGDPFLFNPANQNTQGHGVTPGEDHTVEEVNIPEGYAPVGYAVIPFVQELPECPAQPDGDGVSALVNLEPDTAALVCFYNEKATGTITIVKDADPADGTSFGFTGLGGGFSLLDGESATFTELVAGVYTIEEILPLGWALNDIQCTLGTNPVAIDVTSHFVMIDLAADDDITCTFFNGEVDIDIEKATNGADADAPTGPFIPVGDLVTWTYVVTNTGGTTVTNIVVTDDQIGTITTCPETTLGPGESMTCTATGTAEPGQYENLATVTGDPDEPDAPPVTDEDPSHYFGVIADIDIEKHTNGADADVPTTNFVTVGQTVIWQYFVTNLSNVTVTDIVVTDLPDFAGDPAIAVSCPATSLAPGASMTCTASGIARSGLYTNEATVEGDTPVGEVSDSDPSHYSGSTPVTEPSPTPEPTQPSQPETPTEEPSPATPEPQEPETPEPAETAAATPIAPDTGSGVATGGSAATGAILLLAFGLLALSGGLGTLAFARRRS